MKIRIDIPEKELRVDEATAGKVSRHEARPSRGLDFDRSFDQRSVLIIVMPPRPDLRGDDRNGMVRGCRLGSTSPGRNADRRQVVGNHSRGR